MITTETARMLSRYNAWANRAMFDAVATLPAGEAIKERRSLFTNIVHTLNHIYIIEVIWRCHLEGRPHSYTARNTPDHPPLQELWTLQQCIDRWYVDWAGGLSDAAFGEQVSFILIGGNHGVMTRGQVLLHVVNHGSYHRGFTADLFFQVPAQPPLTDLPVYLREIGTSG